MSKRTVPVRFHEAKDGTEQERDYFSELESYIASGIGSHVEKLMNFAKYVPRQSLTRFLSRYEIFKQVLAVQGSVVECGVLFGGGLMSFAQLSAILEPVNHQRRIIGFDTFNGFTDIHEADQAGESANLRPGGFSVDSHQDLEMAADMFDINRFLSHIPKIELVKGDARRTIPSYLEENPHTVVSLLYLDFDVYEPTKVALQHFLPRMPKGSIVAFDELNAENWPGETQAVLETVGLSRLNIKRFPFDTFLSYAVLD